MKKVGFIGATDARWLMRVCGSAVIVVAAVAGLIDCSSSDPADDGQGGQGGGTVVAPKIPHTPPDESQRQMCVICHTCGTDGVSTGIPTIDRTHDVCNSCHAPDGGLKIHTDGGCEWQMDCDTNPPTINCDTSGCHNIAEVNDMCEACHEY